MVLPEKKIFLFVIFLLRMLVASAQSPDADSASTSATQPPRVKLFSLKTAPVLHKGRIWLSAGGGAAVYAGLSVALWNAWYRDYPLTRFHAFNDWGEWLDMDKAGHFFSAYLGCNYAFRGACWTGMSRRSSAWTAAGVGMGIMMTFEIMDGFSEQWGFSTGDVAFNTLGVGLFASQELLWQEQRIQMKVSGVRPDYSQELLYSEGGAAATTLDDRAAGLYGTNFFHVILKDYNALTVWGSVNIHSFIKSKESSRFPRWLNLALGYGANNLYGGFENSWTTGAGEIFTLDPQRYPRYRQFYLSPDFDWTRIPTKHRWLKFTLGLFNWLKFPAPALEVNTLGKLRFHPLHW